MIPFSVKCDYQQGICLVNGGFVRCKMPTEMISIVSTGLGVSVLAGILSGVCYVLAHGIGRRSRKKKNTSYCEVCGSYLNSTRNILNDDIVKCLKCGAKTCKEKCSKFIQHSQWICLNCLKPPESWFKGLLKIIQPSSHEHYNMFGSIMDPQQNNPDLDSFKKLEKEQVRDFIEKLVNVMLGENVDNASVSLLYNDKQYLPITGQSPCTAHAALKQLIEKLLKEAVNLPLLEKAHAHPSTPSEDATNKTYEDLLATAIINKVISSCQNNLPSSSANSVSSRISSSSRIKDDKEYFFGEETLDSKWKKTDLDTTSVSSIEEWIQSEASFGSRKYVDKVTLEIKQNIEEVDHYDSEQEDDDAEYFRSSSSLLNDSDSNWFLQKRHFQGTHSPVPVPMLVPNPTTEAKVLIGDTPLVETSDLSDVGSDFEESEPAQAHSTLLVKSKKLIGGGTRHVEGVENGDEHSESSTDSGVKEVNGNEQKVFDVPDFVKTDITVDDDNVEDSSFTSIYSNTEKEAEYTEKYASIPRQILKSSTPKSRKDQSYSDCEYNDRKEEYDARESNSDFEYVGSYSKKEKEKWKHAIEMKNNPYSKENIEKRIKRSNSAASSCYGPDYYAKLARSPSGGKLQNSEINGVSWPPPQKDRSRSPSPVPKLPTSPPPRQPSKSTSPLSETIDLVLEKRSITPPPELPKTAPPPRPIETSGIQRAVQAIITPEVENSPFTTNTFNFPVKLDTPMTSTMTLEITSDSDVSYVNFYDVEHSQVYRKTKDENIHIPIRATPVGLSYRPFIGDQEDSKQESVDHEVPVAKPRVLSLQNKNENGLNVKATPAIRQRDFHSHQKSETHNLRRHVSESSLIEDSFDTPPKVLHQKKDNTLISKIYKDPKVRLFALHSREEVVGHEPNKPVFQTQQSFDSKVIHSENNNNASFYLSKGKSYQSSDDGVTSEYESGKTGKMSFFSSEEDLLSLNSDTSGKHDNIEISTRNNNVKVIEKAASKEDLRSPSPYYQLTPRATHIKKFAFGSYEDLLSIDEVSSIPKRKDNTLISKIYQDPNVRSFAIKTHGNLIQPSTPIQKEPQTSIFHEEDDYAATQILKPNTINRKTYSSYDDLSSTEISLDCSTVNEFEQNLNKPTIHSDANGDSSNSEDMEIDSVAKRHIVQKNLGKFSKSEMSIQSTFERSTSLESGDGVRLSVRDLRKKFESSDGNSKPVISSLTARSLSKQVKEILKI